MPGGGTEKLGEESLGEIIEDSDVSREQAAPRGRCHALRVRRSDFGEGGRRGRARGPGTRSENPGRRAGAGLGSGPRASSPRPTPPGPAPAPPSPRPFLSGVPGRPSPPPDLLRGRPEDPEKRTPGGGRGQGSVPGAGRAPRSSDPGFAACPAAGRARELGE